MNQTALQPAISDPPVPAAQAEGRRGSAAVWVILAAGTFGHLVSLAQGRVIPGYFQTVDWLLGGVLLLWMLGLGVANFLGWAGRRQLVSLILLSNIAFLLSRLGISLFVVGSSERILTELATLLIWLLTMPMIEASMRTSPLTQRVSAALPYVLMAMSLVFAFTPGGAGARPEVWFGLFQLSLVCLSVMLGARFINSLRAALRSSRADNQALSRMAFLDPLTDLKNRSYLDEHLREQVLGGQPFTVLFLDLDGFKAINDTLGHATGDEVLRLVAARLRQLAPAGSCLARVSGDEFVLGLGFTDPLEVSGVAQQVVDDLGAPFAVGHHLLRVSASVGISRFPLDAQSAHDVMLRADRAMYAVKRSGKNGFRLYSEHLLDQDERRQLLERELRHAQARGELFLEFQPICTLPGGRPVCLEALSRWQHAEFGLVGPEVFIPIAEECGLITSLGEWALQEALGVAARWRAAGFRELRLAVNVSPLQLMQPHFVEMVAAELERAGVPASALELEVTEGIDLRGRLQISQSVEGLRALGVGLSLDDFGTGFASLSRLNDLPLQVVKIDRVFVADLTGTEDPARSRYVRTLIAAMVAVAATLRLKLVAEGVETPEQGRELLALGCTQAQGFLFAPSVPEEELLAVLSALNQNSLIRNSEL
ncbi:putative bifunctional diguanylate cyclase/phosphodiesterase [Deinococcus koreensis]|uniref:GGDEF-domain containing protein n=1 Tax=Deinococcus koreensis TaxID=2054903 RepID=A0A2K3UZZ3_9DEIO|nr:bifunctional diguanylate cyclase/phosphodiesterase [Deinococcus koreensis]PNY82116.1 GGDEF-domain containing protein [Deinococcus koreensis]